MRTDIAHTYIITYLKSTCHPDVGTWGPPPSALMWSIRRWSMDTFGRRALIP